MERVSSKAAAELRAAFCGDVLEPSDGGYDEARQLHNGLIDKRPGLIARCQGTADVADAVKFGREHGMEISVRGGGHNVAGRAVTEGGLMVDLSPMRGIHVDPGSGTARAQGGVTWGEYDRATQLYGLASTGGTVSTTGIAGLTLGGGVGWLMGAYGMAIDTLRSVELVTADAEVMVVDQDREPDLFWAVRGGGGNFGVASWFEYETHPLTDVLGGLVVYPLAQANAVLDAYREVTSDCPDELAVACALVHAPDGSGAKIVAPVVCHIGDPKRAEKDIQPLRESGTPLLDAIQPMPYPIVNTLLDDGFPRGARYYWKSAFFKELDQGAMDVMVAALESSPSIMSGMLIEHFHGHVTRVAPNDTAFPHRQPGYSLVLVAQWTDPGADEANINWARETFRALGPYMANAFYVNYLDNDDTDRVRAAYGPNWERLVQLKTRYDPENVFHLNQNISPSTT